MAAAAPLMCAGVTVYTALKNSQIRPGDWVVVSGAGGGLGHLGIQYAKAMGGKVIGIDHGSKERFCRDVGADEFLDFTQFQSNATLASRLKKLTGGGAKVALVCSAKSYPQALAWLGLRGTMACIALPEKPGSFLPDVGTLILQELRIIGQYCLPEADYALIRQWTSNTRRQVGQQAGHEGMSRICSARQGEARLPAA